jgi:hypothetical protein
MQIEQPGHVFHGGASVGQPPVSRRLAGELGLACVYPEGMKDHFLGHDRAGEGRGLLHPTVAVLAGGAENRAGGMLVLEECLAKKAYQISQVPAILRVQRHVWGVVKGVEM